MTAVKNISAAEQNPNPTKQTAADPFLTLVLAETYQNAAVLQVSIYDFCRQRCTIYLPSPNPTKFNAADSLPTTATSVFHTKSAVFRAEGGKCDIPTPASPSRIATTQLLERQIPAATRLSRNSADNELCLRRRLSRNFFVTFWPPVSCRRRQVRHSYSGKALWSRDDAVLVRRILDTTRLS